MAIEQDGEVKRILERAAAAKHADLEAWETALRAAVLAAGAKALGGLLADVGSGHRSSKVICDCGKSMESAGLKAKELLTILGPVEYRRSMFQCPGCGKTRYPGDKELDVVGTSRSPGVRRMTARAGSKSTFKEGRDDLQIYAGIAVSAKDVERIAEGIGEQVEAWLQAERKELLRREATETQTEKTIPIMYVCYDGTGVPMIKSEVEGRKGKGADGKARTREAKLGCVFTQTTTDEQGRPVRDPESTTFVGAIEEAHDFGWRIYAEALRRGLASARRVVVLGDGAKWIKTIALLHFFGAIQIVDLYHARQHVAALCKILFSGHEKEIVRQRTRWWTDMDDGNIQKIIREAAKRLPLLHPQARGEAKKEVAFLERNKERMRYADFRAQGLFVGSGVVEAGCKTVIGSRCKQSGMEWSVRGANAIISLRCMMMSGRLEDFWEARAA
ncbi:MAG TPA: ISKra4 family transposase [Blastocatellia bacterium]|nr:ISKra4 family transposase [Blastocatellia bacterium]